MALFADGEDSCQKLIRRILLLIFIFMSWLGEKANFTGFHGAVAEELAEFGAYMMMLYLLRYALKAAQKTDK